LKRDQAMVLDVELWQPSPEQSEIFFFRVQSRLKELGGTLISEYSGHSMKLMRIEATGEAIAELLKLPEIA
jgi:hypothetical protein